MRTIRCKVTRTRWFNDRTFVGGALVRMKRPGRMVKYVKLGTPTLTNTVNKVTDPRIGRVGSSGTAPLDILFLY